VTDPRTSIIDERLNEIRNIIAVSSGKGGVGKSLVASVLALTLARNGCKVGFFDLDFTSPSSHVILSVGDLYPKEEKGIIPPEVHGLKYMSIVYYAGERASPLRGTDVSNALIELLAVTMWDDLDFLIIDMPPGISDATLDLLRFIKDVKFLLVTTPSRLAFETIRKLIGLLSGLNVPVVGVIENMKMKDSRFIQQQVEGRGLRFLGEVPFDPELEENIGDVEKLLETRFSKELEEIIKKSLET
jgi:ATP-binding protein involved in chromosome partitioning